MVKAESIKRRMNMQAFSALFGFGILILRIAVPIYLHWRAKETQLPQPGWWILFGIFQPIGALMLYYIVDFIKGRTEEKAV